MQKFHVSYAENCYRLGEHRLLLSYTIKCTLTGGVYDKSISLIIYLYLFLPFKNADGEIITVKIIEKSIGSIMYGTIESKNFDNRVVRIRFVSRRFIDYFALYFRN